MTRVNSARTHHRSSCRAVLPLVLCVAMALLRGVAWGEPSSPPVSPPPSSARGSLIGPYLGAPFQLTRNAYNFGQAPAWTTGDRVLSHEYDSAGVRQVYRAKLDGSAQECLTCNTVKGPNGFPQDRPQSDWILFQSYGQQPIHTGGPGFGGYGGDLYVMRPDGSQPYRLTTNSDPDNGREYTADTGVPYDNFHAFWSPNGKQIIWTHTEAHPIADGGQTWTMLLGDFVVEGGVPSIKNVIVVGKPYGVYETQPWAPDGSGFLFCAAGGYASPYQANPPGWAHMGVYFMRLYGPGASPQDPQVTLLSDEVVAYQEQALITPDMRTVIMMSNRNASRESWYNLVVAAAQRTKFDAPDTGSTQTMQFLSDFIGPGGFVSDLYAVDVKTKAIRQLTNFGGVVPEFFWNRNYSKIIFAVTGLETWVGEFQGVSRRISTAMPAPGLEGEPVDMSRIGAQAQPIRDPGPTDNVSIAVPPPSNPAPAFPHAAESSDKPRVPKVAADYFVRWLGDLQDLYEQSKDEFTKPPLFAVLDQFVGN
jgi:Tol biopolymer transport system component